jgi:methylmalonyl-CoA mutase cobalamin-binding subunit
MAMQTIRTFGGSNGADRLLVATPAGERHAIGAALIGAIAAVQGWGVVYVGADLPASEIASAAVATRVRLVALSVVYIDDPQRVLGELRALRALLPRDIGVITGGSGAMSIAQELGASGIQVGGSLAAWTDELQRQSVA